MIIEVDKNWHYEFEIKATDWWKWPEAMRKFVVRKTTVSLNIPLSPKNNETISIGLYGEDLIHLSKYVKL